MRAEFPQKVRAQAALRCEGKCEGVHNGRRCGVRLTDGGYHFDHVIPDALGGDATLENCEVLCLPCHKAKTTKGDVPRIAKAKRQESKSKGTQRLPHPMPGSRRSRFKRRMDGTVVERSPSSGASK